MSRQHRRAFAIFIVGAFILVVGALVAPRRFAPDADTVSGPLQQLVIVQGQEPQGVDAHIHGSMLNSNPGLHIMEPLVMRNDQLEPVPWLAASWEWENPTTLHMQLRRDVTFHDGSPFVADDVRFTFERIMDPETGSTHYTYINPSTIRDVEVRGDHALTFHLKEPFAPFLQHLFQIGIASRQAFEKLGAREHARRPVGTGPYIIREWEPGRHILMEANPHWWNETPLFPELKWQAVSEDATRVALLTSGAAHIVTAFPPALLDEVRRIHDDNEPAATIKKTSSLRSVWVRFNAKKEPLNDVRVREAINLAVDVERIVEHVLQGYGRRLHTVIGPDIFGFDPEVEPIPYDPERARALLQEAGHGDGLVLNFAVREGRLMHELEVAEAIVADLAAVGVRVNMTRITHDRYLEMARNYTDEFDLFMASNANNSADAHWNLQLNFTSEGRGIYWSDAELDRLVKEAASTVDEQSRTKLYSRALSLMRQQWPVLFMYNQVDLYGVAANLQWEPRPDDFIYAPGMTFQ